MKDFHICILNANVENGLYTGLSYSVNLLYVSVKFVKAKSCMLLCGYKNSLMARSYTVVLTNVCKRSVNICYAPLPLVSDSKGWQSIYYYYLFCSERSKI